MDRKRSKKQPERPEQDLEGFEEVDFNAIPTPEAAAEFTVEVQ